MSLITKGLGSQNLILNGLIELVIALADGIASEAQSTKAKRGRTWWSELRTQEEERERQAVLARDEEECLMLMAEFIMNELEVAA